MLNLERKGGERLRRDRRVGERKPLENEAQNNCIQKRGQKELRREEKRGRCGGERSFIRRWKFWRGRGNGQKKRMGGSKMGQGKRISGRTECRKRGKRDAPLRSPEIKGW